MSMYMEIKEKYDPNHKKYICEIEIISLIFILISLCDTKFNSLYKPLRG
jgi:hypothetical protein